MRIAWAVPCRYAEVVENVAHILGGGISVVHVPEVPTTVGLFVALCIGGSEHELGEDQQHIVSARALNPAHEEILPQLDIPFAAPHWGPAGGESTFVLPLQPVMPISEFGLHMLEFNIDGRSTTTVPINVVEALPA